MLTVIGGLVARYVDSAHPLWLATGIWAVATGLFVVLRWIVVLRWTDPYTRDYPP